MWAFTAWQLTITCLLLLQAKCCTWSTRLSNVGYNYITSSLIRDNLCLWTNVSQPTNISIHRQWGRIRLYERTHKTNCKQLSILWRSHYPPPYSWVEYRNIKEFPYQFEEPFRGTICWFQISFIYRKKFFNVLRPEQAAVDVICAVNIFFSELSSF